MRKIANITIAGLLTVSGVQIAMAQYGVKTSTNFSFTTGALDANKIHYGKPALNMLPAGDIKPLGWIWKQMDVDLREGLPGNYHKVSHMGNNEIFVNKNGTLGDPYTYRGGSASRSWWIGEVEGNQLDAKVRLAFLTSNAEYKERVKKQIEDILVAQKREPDGYIGIYVPADRFALCTETKYNNGELWTQEKIFQPMLAYYEYTKDVRVLEAVKKAVDCTLAHYVGKKVFGQGSGVSHGVAFTDTLEWLYRLTSDPKYAVALQWLYEDFSTKEGEKQKADHDMSYDELKNSDSLWCSHTPHVLEGLHMPAITHRLTGAEKYKLAADHVLLKYDRHDTPGGGLPCDEGIDKRFGTSWLPREICGSISTIMALNRIAVWTGDLEGSSRAETIAFNSMQGARLHPALQAVRYCSHDNQKDASNLGYGARYVYSAAHCAPCCVTSCGRLMPYYLEGMWFADHGKNELIANYYGPNRLDTTLAGKKVSLNEETEFPFSDKIKFVFNTDTDAALVLRKPPYCGDIMVVAKGARVEVEPHKVLLRHSWKKGDVVAVDFNFRPQLIAEPNLTNSYYYRWGVLLFALPLGEDARKIRECRAGDDPSGMYLWAIKPLHPEFWDYKIDPMAAFVKVDMSDGSYDMPFANPPIGLRGAMIGNGGKHVEMTLIPLGASQLRRTSFPDYSLPVVGPQNELIKRGISNPDGTMKETSTKKAK